VTGALTCAVAEGHSEKMTRIAAGIVRLAKTDVVFFRFMECSAMRMSRVAEFEPELFQGIASERALQYISEVCTLRKPPLPIAACFEIIVLPSAFRLRLESCPSV